MATEKRRLIDVHIGRGLNTVKDASMSNVKNWTVHIETGDKDVGLASNEHAWKNASIFKVPAFVRKLNSKAFTPELVSLGPYHHEDCELNLMEMEIHKEEALVQFIRRAGKPLNKLMKAVDSVSNILQDLYYGLDEKWRRNKDDFLKLMVTDGCFMFEILHFAVAIVERENSSCNPFLVQHGIHHIMPFIRRDMLKIENQLPLLLLKTLVAFQNPQLVNEDIDSYVDRLVLKFFAGRINNIETTSPRHHMLGLFRQSLLTPLPTTQINKPPPPLPIAYTTPILRCVIELDFAGIRFRKSHTNSLRDIRFNPKTGILQLPVLVVDDATESTFLNIMAYEDQHVSVDCDVTSYVCFMHDIIHSEDDVRFLQNRGIILNSLGSYKAVVDLFISISKELVFPESSLIQVRQQVYDYCQKSQKLWRANLTSTYFNNPWSSVTLLNTVIILILTVIQAIFAIKQSSHGQ